MTLLLTITCVVFAAVSTTASRPKVVDVVESPVNPQRNYYLDIGGKWPNATVFNTTREIGPNVINQGKVVIFGQWSGVYPCLNCGGQAKQRAAHGWCNGGIPQLANLTLHVETLVQNVKMFLPALGLDAATYDGFVVVDWESWLPSYTFTSKYIPEYREASMNYTAWKYPHIAELNNSGPILEQLSASEWEAAALEFLVATIATLKAQIPRSQGLGFYAYPTAYGFDELNKTEVENANDGLMPLWQEVTAFFPSIYLPYKTTEESQPTALYYNRTKEWISRQMVEANRLAALAGPPAGTHGAIKVLPYTWYRYNDGEEPNFAELLTPTDAWLEFDFPFSGQFPTDGENDTTQHFIDGVIIWGSESNATNAVRWMRQNKEVFTSPDPVNPHHNRASHLPPGNVINRRKTVNNSEKLANLSAEWSPPKWSRCTWL